MSFAPRIPGIRAVAYRASIPLGVAIVVTASAIELTLTIAASIAIVFALSWIAGAIQ